MYNWRFLVITVLAALQPIACFSERALADGRQCCERDAAQLLPDTRHSHDHRKIGNRQPPSFRQNAPETRRDVAGRYHELKNHRFTELRISPDRTRDAVTARDRYSSHSGLDSQRRLQRTTSERIGEDKNRDGRSKHYRERAVSLSERRSQPDDTRITTVREVRGDRKRSNDRRERVLLQTRSFRVERESGHGRRTAREVSGNDRTRFEATRRDRRSDSTFERREVTRRTREASSSIDDLHTRLTRSSHERRDIGRQTREASLSRDDARARLTRSSHERREVIRQIRETSLSRDEARARFSRSSHEGRDTTRQTREASLSKDDSPARLTRWSHERREVNRQSRAASLSSDEARAKLTRSSHERRGTTRQTQEASLSKDDSPARLTRWSHVRREVTRQTRVASLFRDEARARLTSSHERISEERVAGYDRRSRQMSVRTESLRRDARRSHSLPSERVRIIRYDASMPSDNERRERDDIQRIDRQRSRSTERAAEDRERRTYAGLSATTRTKLSRATKERSVDELPRNRLDVRRNDLARKQRPDLSRLLWETRISERDIRRTSSRDLRLDGNLQDRRTMFTDRADTRRVRSSSFARIDVLERGRIDFSSRSRSLPKLDAIEIRTAQRMSTANRSKVAQSEEFQLLAENWKSLAFYTLQGLYLCCVLFRVFSNTSPEKKITRLSDWWPMSRRAIKQD